MSSHLARYEKIRDVVRIMIALNAHVSHSWNRRNDKIAINNRKMDFLSSSETESLEYRSVQIVPIQIIRIPPFVNQKCEISDLFTLLTWLTRNYRVSLLRKINVTLLIDLPNVTPMTFLSLCREKRCCLILIFPIN